MKAIIDLALLGILIICVWSGYKKGLIMGLGGILCIIISLYGANLLSNAFALDVVPALRPFAGGFMESVASQEDGGVLDRMGWEDSDYSLDDLLEQYPERKAEFAEACYESIGIYSNSAGVMAQEAVTYSQETDSDMVTAVVEVLCRRVSYVGCFILAFLLIIIVLTVIGNLPNLSFRLPHLDLVNDISGAILGLVTGLMFCAAAVWALKFVGILIGSDTLESTILGGWLLRKDFLFRYLGI